MSIPAGEPERTKVCRGACGERKYLRDFHRNSSEATGYHGMCKSCRRKSRKPCPRRAHSDCLDCGKRTKRTRRCGDCRALHQARVEAAAPVTISPRICALMVRGRICGEALLDGTDNLGRGVTYCGVHGERPVAIIRPDGFMRYSQRPDFEKHLQEAWVSVQSRARKGPNGRADKSWQQNFQVVGRELARKIEVA